MDVYYIHLCVCGTGMCHVMYVEVMWGKLVLSLPCGSWGLNSGYQAWHLQSHLSSIQLKMYKSGAGEMA